MTKAIEPASAHSVATKPATQQSATATEAVIDAPTTKTEQAAQGSKTLEPADIVKNKALLGGYAYHIIRQQSKQISKLRSQVLADTDIEDLHEMRISSRRLRSALGIFSDVVEISSPNEKSGKKSGKKKAAKKGNNNNNLIKGLKDLITKYKAKSAYLARDDKKYDTLITAVLDKMSVSTYYSV